MTSGTEGEPAHGTRATFDSIANCPNVDVCLDGATEHPCYKIVSSQGKVKRSEFQLPEPWVGQIDIAPLLFVSSNPSIGEDEHATGFSSPQEVWESHQLAFGGGSRQYIINGITTTRPDGTAIKNVAYWISVRARAAELLPTRAVAPGVDYALTEVVHCKTKDEYGVRESLDECFARHMERVWAVSAAKVVVVFGKLASRKILGNSPASPAAPLDLDLGGRRRIVTFLPHPSSFGTPKTFQENYSSDHLARLRALLD